MTKKYTEVLAHLFIVQIPRPGDSERTFSVSESSCHITTCLTVQR